MSCSGADHIGSSRRTSPLQNRVSPTGEIVAHPARGLWMGNRGILHGDTQQLGVSRWRHQAWVTCVLSFKGIRRSLMSPGRYTELFFGDEAVALAAGHRPCAECRRSDFNRFQEAFSAAHSQAGAKIPAPEMDKILHKARVHSRSRMQRTYRAEFDTLPEGTFFRLQQNGAPLLMRGGAVWAWSFDGYSRVESAISGEVEVLTPEPTVNALRAGYVVELRRSR